MKRSAGCVIIPFALFWCALVGVFDVFVLGGVIRQLATLNYRPVNAVIRSSEMSSSTNSDGETSYKPQITFAYTVDGREYQGDKVAHSLPFSSAESVGETVAHFPAGSQTTAYVANDDPQVAVLQKGLTALDLMVVMFLTPFNLVGLALIFACLPTARHKSTGGVEIVESIRETRALVHPNHPLVAVAAALGGGSFLGIFVVFLGSRIFPLSAMVAMVWVAILALCFESWRRTRAKRSKGQGDLVIHKLDKSVQLWRLPLERCETHSRSALERLSLMEEKRKDSDGDTISKHVLRLHLKSGDALSLRESADEEDARAFANWLRAQLGGIPLD